MTPQQLHRRKIARDILIHLMIHGTLENKGITDNCLPVARELEREGVIGMADNKLDFVLIDKQKAQFLLHG